ncbi:cobaltochelatase subunit CobN [Variovorax sp. J22G73]|uniref:cobaltochelatase subunit CobN n=1 Tax=unclassified Variovorax TaxID=663243 RepID=UPI000D5FC003|nr:MULTISPECIES: cobaltochelatase subunit CobN [unclassified Variovorax]MDM0005980.1 cobaltochelatase subunit CobN [Variovorax sp. J22R203]MDM0097996.1 cobaltochelatase subunit CobN [Variovorax sp. J22G73]
MHLLSTQPGRFVEDDSVVTRLDQTPGDIVVLSSADTTLALLAAARTALAATDPGYPSLRLANLMYLKQPASLDLYIDEVLQHARVVVVDHLGAESAWAYGLQQLEKLAKRKGQQLAMFSGDLQEDEDLLARGTVPRDVSRQLWQYTRSGGAGNAMQFLRSVAFHGLGHGEAPLPPRSLPQVALHVPHAMGGMGAAHTVAGIDDLRAGWHADAPVVALVFYRSHLLSGNTVAFDAMAAALSAEGLNPLPVALDSLKDPLCLSTFRGLCAAHDVQLVLNTTAFAALGQGMQGMQDDDGDEAEAEAVALAGDAPVLQVIVSGGNREDWLADSQGLRPRDIAMQIALPEMDGRIVTRAISFKGLSHRCELTQTEVVNYQPEPDRVAFVAELARRWCRLRSLRAEDKRVALILANYPGSEGRIGSGVGLDTPASVVGLLRAMQAEGYALGAANAVPEDGDALMRKLQQGIANDPDQWAARPAWQSYALADYSARLAALPEGMAAAIDARWGTPAQDPMVRQGRFMIAGLRLGRVFVGIQPARALGGLGGLGAANGSGAADYASYHDAELVPPHSYLAFYFWLRDVFAIDAVVHVGKHGNLEWLPGKSLALSQACWPDAILGPLPNVYPFIVNDPGEGAQAKRRTQAVIVDHLMPPLTRAENHGPLQDLERQVDEYYDALLVDARRAKVLRAQILSAVRAQHLVEELGMPGAEDDAVLARVDAYLCELKETQIRDGLHVFGASPQGRLRRDTLLALARYPALDGAGDNAGLLGALARDLLPGDAFDPLDIDAAVPWQGARPALLQSVSTDAWRHQGDTRERLELLAQRLLEAGACPHELTQAAAVMRRVERSLAPALDACGPQELLQFSRALQGRFVPPGPSGSPSRGRPDVLPTGRNFYAVDTRAIPTPTAWMLGLKSAAQLVERHLQEHGDYPVAMGLSVWGTATMRTGGDDLAQAFALIGVRPKWAPGSQRVVDFEVLPTVGIGRPRIDVTLRISGFFRDAFPNAVQMFDAAVQAVAAQEDEDAERNPIRARILREAAALQAQGASPDDARLQAGWRVFGSAPGSYGSGLQPLFDHGDWQTDDDLSKAYVGGSAHAYGQGSDGVPAAAALTRRLRAMNVVMQNQDSREHDLLDSNDYYQFQGGMAAAVRHLSGRQPAMYHGDHGNPQAPRVRTLKEEISRVIRSRVVNPKWIDGVKRHGYKGAFEMAATVDYLFGFDATARVVGDHQYAMVADAYVLDADTRDFVNQHNPRALHDMLSRLLEAMQRGLWQQPGGYKDQLENLLLDHEQQMEGLPR